MAEDDVERCIRVGKGVYIRDLKGIVCNVATTCYMRPCPLEYCLNGINSSDLPVWDELGKVRGNCARAAANVQDGVVWL